MLDNLKQLEVLLNEKILQEQKDSKVEKIYGYYNKEFKGAKEKLRIFLRFMHGYDEKENAGIGTARENSPLLQLRDGKRVWVSDEPKNSTITVLEDKQDLPKTKGVLIDGADVKRQQKEVDILFDETRITAKEVYDLQLIKAGREKDIELPEGREAYEYRRHLEQLGSYVVIRGKVWQSHEYNGRICDKPQERILYYANFPKLMGKESKDINYFCEKKGDDYYLKEDLKGKLKKKFKAVIRLQAKMAAKYKEAVDIVTPNAFFYGLERKTEQQKAKEWFAEAVIEFAKEEPILGFVGLFVHADLPGIEQALKDQSEFKTRIIVNQGNAASPGRLANENSYGFKVADCIMGEACGHAGNSALTNGAGRAKEENDARVMSLMQLIFGPQFNEFLMEKVRVLAGIKSEPEPNKGDASSQQLLYTTCLYGLAGVLVIGAAAVALNIGGIRDVCSKLVSPLFSADEGRSIGF